jgi:hypothetical protein
MTLMAFNRDAVKTETFNYALMLTLFILLVGTGMIPS